MKKRKLLSVLVVVFAVCFSSQGIWAAPPDHVDLPDHAAASDKHGDTPDLEQDDMDEGATWNERIRQPGARSGIIKTKKHVYYCDSTNDVLSLSVVLPHSLKCYWDGESDAHLVVQLPEDASPDGGAILSTKLDFQDFESPEGEDSERHVIQDVSLGDIPCEELEGDFQIALILTELGGDPLNLLDWYDGFQGLVAFSKINFSLEENAEDPDGDGEVNGDSNGNGYRDE